MGEDGFAVGGAADLGAPSERHNIEPRVSVIILKDSPELFCGEVA